MPVNTVHRTKARSMELMMKNPQLRRMIKDAWEAPVGSSRRDGAKHVMSIMTKLHNVQNDPGVAHMEVNPWADLPQHRPVLNYAVHAPKQQKSSSLDGQGGPGPANMDGKGGTLPASPFDVSGVGFQFDPSFSTPSAIAASNQYLADKAAKEKAGIFSGAPSAPSASSGSIAVSYGPPVYSPTKASTPASSFPSLSSSSMAPSNLSAWQSAGLAPTMAAVDANIAKMKTGTTSDGLFTIQGGSGNGLYTTAGGLSVPVTKQVTSPPSSIISAEKKPGTSAATGAPLQGPGLVVQPGLRYSNPPISTLPGTTSPEGIKAMLAASAPKTGAATQAAVQQATQPQQYQPTKPADNVASASKIGQTTGLDVVKLKSIADQAFQNGQNWGEVYNYFRQNLPETISNTDIDNFLDTKWKNAGAFEQWKAEQQTAPKQQGSGAKSFDVTANDVVQSPSSVNYPGISAGITASSSSGASGISSTGTPGTQGLTAGNTLGVGSTSTGSTGILGQYDLNSIPGLDINAPENQGLSMTQYETKALNTISQMDDAKWNQAFPGIPKPTGATLSGQIDSLIQMKRNDLGLDDLLKQRTQMLNENPTFVQDARDYIVQHDQQMKQIDTMLDDVKSMPMPDDPTARGLLTSYQSYLNVMKGKTAQRYSTYLNKAVDVRNQQVTQLDSEISAAQQELQMAIPSIQSKATEDYTRILKIIDENAQKPAVAAQMAAQSAKDQQTNFKNNLDLLKTQLEIGKLQTGTTGDDFQKQVTDVVNFVTDPNTKGWNLSLLNIPDFQAKYGKDPDVVLAAMQKIMPTSIDSMKADRLTNKAPAGGLTSTLDLLQNYEASIKSLNDSLTSQIVGLQQQNPSDPRIAVLMGSRGKLNDVQAQLTRSATGLFGDELSRAWTGLNGELSALSGDPGGWFGWGKKSSANFGDPATKSKWVSSAVSKTGLDSPFVSTIWDMLAGNIQAGGDPALIKTYSASSLAADLAKYYEAMTGVNTDYTAPTQ